MLLDRELYSKYATIDNISTQILKLGVPQESSIYSDPALFRNTEVLVRNYLTPFYLNFLESDSHTKYLIELESVIGMNYPLFCVTSIQTPTSFL
jgi:hypothetical protein